MVALGQGIRGGATRSRYAAPEEQCHELERNFLAESKKPGVWGGGPTVPGRWERKGVFSVEEESREGGKRDLRMLGRFGKEGTKANQMTIF